MGECLEVMRDIPDDYFDMVLCDLPYGTTDCKWDSVIPIDDLWSEYERIAKPNAAIILTATQPFTTILMTKGLSKNQFKTFWIWNKAQSGSFALAKYHPLRITEDVLVFCNGHGALNTYNPIMRKGKLRKKGGAKPKNEVQSGLKQIDAKLSDDYYPTNIIEITNGRFGKIHPTQKPVELFEYLIKTYSNEGDRVLDNCAGSGTTAIACENTDREWVCIEQLEEYANKAVKRIENHIIKKQGNEVPADILEKAMENGDE